MRLLLDTCVWFNFLESEKTLEVLQDIEKLLNESKIDLIVPEQVIVELDRNSEKVLKSQKSRIETYRKHAAKLKKVITEPNLKALDEILKETDAAIPALKAECDEVFALVKKVISHKNAKLINITDDIKIKATDRGLLKKAPFNKGAKNSMGDAVILEAALKYQRENGNDKLYFVTLNNEDFSDSTNRKIPHKDIEGDFSATNIVYSILPGDIIEEIANIPVSTEAKESFRLTYSDNYMPIWSNEVPKSCYECGGELQDIGYRVMRGYAGDIYICKNCGMMHQILDSSY